MKPFLLFFLFPFFLSASAQKPKPALNHIAVYVTDLARSTAFYRDVVGLDTIPEPFHDGRHTWFQVAERSHLHLISGAEKVTEHNKNGHLCFSVPSVAVFMETLKNANVPFEDWSGKKGMVTTRADGIRQLYFRDPDGYWIEINDDYK